jgi:hypothetical protein
MGRVMVEQVCCDFCGYGGPLTRPADFRHYAAEGVDLCPWCAASGSAVAWTECGGHRVTFPAEGGQDWWCSCGATLSSECPPVLTAALVARFPMIGVPRRLAELHTQGWDTVPGAAGFPWPR